jgi:peptide/nickel transport system permease protein
MFNYVLDRLKSSIVVLFVVSIITFFVLMIIPGNPAQLILGADATPEAIQELHAAMGLDRPLYQQYFSWLLDLLKLDMGKSYVYGESVTVLIAKSIPVTFSISIFAMIMAAFIAFLFGMISAIKKDSIADYFSRSIMQLGAAIPSFWIGMVFIVYFGVRRKINYLLLKRYFLYNPVNQGNLYMYSNTPRCLISTKALYNIGMCLRYYSDICCKQYNYYQ